MSSPPGNLDGAIAQGSGGGSAGGRHLAQAPGQPGAACAPLGDVDPLLAGCFFLMRRDRQIWNLRSHPTCVCSWSCRMVVRSDLVALIPFDFPSDLTRGSLTRKGGNMKFCQDGFDSDRRNKFNHMHTRPKQTHTHTHTRSTALQHSHTHTHCTSTLTRAHPHSRLHAEMAGIKLEDFRARGRA